ncbi:hypothetical protein AOLI_G00106620 [Acnodon oligacanthus]
MDSSDSPRQREKLRFERNKMAESSSEQLREGRRNMEKPSVFSTELKRIQQFAVDVTLDADTDHPKLIESDGGKQARDGDTKQHLPDNPERFTYYAMILGKEGFSSGRFFYELQKLQKVGVFVDYEEGLVSFYDVESRSHIYSFTGQSFTEKLYPYFDCCDNDGGKNSAPLIISPVSKTE